VSKTIVPGKRNCPISIYGNYVTGTKQLATVAATKVKELSIDDDDSDDDRHNATQASDTEKQRMLNTEATLALLTDSLLPASVFDIETSSSDDNQASASPTVRSHSSFDMGALLPPSENNESDADSSQVLRFLRLGSRKHSQNVVLKTRSSWLPRNILTTFADIALRCRQELRAFPTKRMTLIILC